LYPKRLTIALYVRGRTLLEQLGVKCLAQGHIGVSLDILSYFIEKMTSSQHSCQNHNQIFHIKYFFTSLNNIDVMFICFSYIMVCSIWY